MENSTATTAPAFEAETPCATCGAGCHRDGTYANGKERWTHAGPGVYGQRPHRAKPATAAALARTAVRLPDVTPAMLAHVQQDADRYKLPQTVWPSKWFGPDFQGVDCLLTSAAAPGLDVERGRPVDAADGSEPFLTVLPTGWYR